MNNKFLNQKNNIESMIKESENVGYGTDISINSDISTSILDTIIKIAVKEDISDIHFDPEDNYILIRYRKDGNLFDFLKINLKYAEKVINIIKNISKLDISNKISPQEGRFNKTLYNRKVDFRVSVIQTYMGEKIVIRILDKEKFVYDISSIGLNKKSCDYLIRKISLSSGLILISGPTGSGKTTSLYTIIDYLNNESNNIYTIEDPIEYLIKGTNQIQINSNKSLEFQEIFKYILRQDPDIIMIGEIRDSSMAKLAIEASLSGHLVLSSIHSNNCLDAILRLTEMGIPLSLINSSLVYLSSQILVKKLCNDCKIKLEENIYTSKGCSKCLNGYKGRLAVHEIIDTDDIFKSNILNQDFLAEYNYISKSNVYLKKLLKEGIISYEEYIKHAR